MTAQEIMAVVVSYNGGAGTVGAVEALAESVGHVHVVDNNSAPDSRAILARLGERPNVSVEYLPENRGIAHALNRGVARAAALGKSWVLTMDQDSRPDGKMIGAFCAMHDRHPENVCMSPRICDHGELRPVKRQVLEYAITSGNLVHLSVYERIGLYHEDLFIDCVDIDFSLRVRKGGMSIHLVEDAILFHAVGEPTPGRAPIKFYTAHSRLRRYYLFRNSVYILRKHAFSFPGFSLKLLVSSSILFSSLPFYEKGVFKTYQWIFDGLFDGVVGNYGPKNNYHHPDSKCWIEP